MPRLKGKYLELLLKEQEIEVSIEDVNKGIQIVKNLLECQKQAIANLVETNNASNQEYADLYEVSDKLESLLNQTKAELHDKLTDLKIKLENSREITNSGNLRHVVYTLYTEQGLTSKEFADKLGLGYTEFDILNLTQNGKLDEGLLNAICVYFYIRKTKQFMQYIVM